MKKELEEALYKDFPNLYRDRHRPMTETAMCWGWCHGNGWYDIIRRLSEKLEAMIVKLPEESRHLCCASQVKEKFGELRFYLTTSSDEMESIIDEAVEESSRTCETCGKPGRLRSVNRWLSVDCDECFGEKIEDPKEVEEEELSPDDPAESFDSETPTKK